MAAGTAISFALPRAAPRRAPPARQTGVLLWLRENFFSSLHNTLLTLLALWALFVTLPDFFVWAVVEAVWWTEDPQVCRQAVGACWAVIAEKHRCTF